LSVEFWWLTRHIEYMVISSTIQVTMMYMQQYL
jgi:hypothetical protein